MVSPKHVTGFSLIELMVVVLIIGLAIGLVTVNIGSGNSAYQQRIDARQFANISSLVLEEAVLSGDQWGIDLYREIDDQGEPLFGYRWLQFDDESGWSPANPRDINPEYEFSPGIDLVLEVESIEVDIEPKKEPARPRTDENEDETQTTTNQLLRADNDDDRLLPDVFLFSSGEMTSFTLDIVNRDEPDHPLRITGDVLGRIRLEEQQQDDQ